MLIPDDLNTFFYLPPIDCRKSMDGLSMIVVQEMKQELTARQLFLFRNKKGNGLKALHYEHHCFSLIYCRLEKGKWVFPSGEVGHLALSQEHLRWMLSSHRYSKMEGLVAESYRYFS